MKKVIFAIAIVALLAAWAALAVAQPARQYLVTGGVGYAKRLEFTTTAVNGAARDGTNFSPDGSFALSAGFFYRAMPELAVGAEVSWLNFGTYAEDGVEDTYTAIPFTGQVLYTIPTSSEITPFATGGAGLYHLRNKTDSPNWTDTAAPNMFGFNVGGGIMIESDANLGFGVDARFHMAVNPKLTFEETDTGKRVVETTNWKMLTVMAKLFF